MTPYYDEDGVTIFHGDARDLLPFVGTADLILADPPYAFGGSRTEWRITASVVIALAQSAALVNRGGALVVMTAASGRGIEFVQGAVNGALPFNRLLVWHKTFVNSAVAGPWRWDIVPILVYGKGTFGRPQFSSCYESNGHGSLGTSHPAELPQGLADWLVRPFTQARTVLDPFVGSGTFLAAAKAAGKRAIGIEKDERYCEMAAERCGQARLALEPVPTAAGEEQVLDFDGPLSIAPALGSGGGPW